MEVSPADDLSIPWWALGMVGWEAGTPEGRLLSLAERGLLITAERMVEKRPEYRDWRRRWQEMTAAARRLAQDHDPLDVARQEPEMARHVALRSPRAFCELTGLSDDDQEPLRLKDFHVRAVWTLRSRPLAEVLLPAQHGKSYLCTMLIPLQDWAEQSEATQIRIYQSYQFTTSMTRKLMALVEQTGPLQVLFPGIRRPEKGDPCEKIWSTKAFSIGAKHVVEPSFRPLTAGASTVGVRADRVICDDWVTEANCASLNVQERLYSYFHTGPMTMRRFRHWESRYGTKWGTLGLVGTIFDRRDLNCRLREEWLGHIRNGDKERAVLRFGVYPDHDARKEGRVLWPERRPLDWVLEQERQLTGQGFQQRYMNVPLYDHQVVFAPKLVESAVSHDFEFGQVPPGGRVIIGYDPAAGSRTRRSKHPAAVVLAFRDHPDPEQRSQSVCHFVEWHRWDLPSPEQLRRLADLARRFDSAVVVETNAQQQSYADWMREIAPEVRVIHHWTGNWKHDVREGVESFQPLFAASLAVIHAKGAEAGDLEALTSEFIEWPQGRYSDLLMAAWIARFQHRQLERSRQIADAVVHVPGFVRQRGGRQLVDLSAYR